MELLIVVQVVLRMAQHNVLRATAGIVGPRMSAIKTNAPARMVTVRLVLPAAFTTLKYAVRVTPVTIYQEVHAT